MAPLNFTHYSLKELNKKDTITLEEWRVLNKFVSDIEGLIRLAKKILEKSRKGLKCLN